MAKKTTPKNPVPAGADVETYVRPEAKRKNIPTAENQKLVADEDKAIKKLRWKRNPDLDPQLVWRGKDFEPDLSPHPEERAAGARLEGWMRGTDLLPSFETHRFAMLLRMRSQRQFANFWASLA